MAQKTIIIPEIPEVPKLESFTDLDRRNPNKLSFWFPKVKDCGIAVPRTTVIPVPDEVVEAMFMEKPGDRERIETFVDKSVMPAVEALDGLPFLKNGCFSDKFRFRYCAPADKDPKTIADCFLNINYDALVLGTWGYTEFVVRERIPSPMGISDIYGGMPLNTEFRVFYDFDRKKLLYTANYWDWDYCHESICGRCENDDKNYRYRYPELLREYKKRLPDVEKTVSECLPKVEGLSGIWSVDLLLSKEGETVEKGGNVYVNGTEDKLWLIDMAIGHQSVYWDPDKAQLHETI